MNNLLNNYNIIDLTHLLEPSIATYEGTSGFRVKTVLDYDRCTGDTKFRVQKLCLNAGIGTHIDAPNHCFSNQKSVADINLDQLIVPIYCLNMSDEANQNYYLKVDDILEFEKRYEMIKPNSLFVFYIGWSKHRPDTVKYRNQNNNGIMNFPGYTLEAANLLLKRGVAGIAIDTLSPDGSDINFPVHQAILSSSKYIIENIANGDKIPAIGAWAIISPLKMHSTESPVRIFALVNKN